jgi:molecular chaperone DnaK
MSDKLVVGIDLGTTFSAAAYVDEQGRPQVIQNSEGRLRTPSVVRVGAGPTVVGEAALNQWVTDQEHVVRWIKRVIGDPEYRFQGLDAVQISAEIIKVLKEDAEHSLGQPIIEAVITCPAYFDSVEIENTKRAGELAGLKVREIVKEPIAAAVCYGVGPMHDGEKIMVCDLGGGMFGATVLTFEKGVFIPLAATGNHQLGGDDWSMELADLAADRIKERLGEDPRDDLVASRMFYEACEQAKRDLSRVTEVAIPCRLQGRIEQVVVTREEFEVRTEWRMQTVVACAAEALEKANMTWADLDRILLVGGSSRLRRMALAFEEASGKQVVHTREPELMVTLGAAILASAQVRPRRPSGGLVESPTPRASNHGAPSRVPAGSSVSRVYQVGRSTITLVFGDLTRSEAEVLVSSDDFLLSMGGGVSASIGAAGGSRIGAEARKMVPAKVGDVIVTSAGDLRAKYVFHAVTLGRDHAQTLPGDAIVRQTTQRSLNLLRALECRSVAFPAIGAGVAQIPYEIVASQMAGAVVDFLLDSPEEYQVELYLMDRRGQMDRVDFFMFFEAFAGRTLGLTATASSSGYSLDEPPAKAGTLDPRQIEETERRHQIFTMLRHLDRRRNQLEAALVHALAADDPDSAPPALEHLRRQLEEVQQLRAGYELELTGAVPSDATCVPASVFVSSTSTDLRPHREVVRSVIEKLQLKFVGMEEFGAAGQAPADLIRRKVGQTEVYVGVLGMRYGYIDSGSGLSMTELEYRQAIASRKPVCMFVMDKTAPITADMVEGDPAAYAKLLEFKNRVMKAHTCAMFTDPADLGRKAEISLRESRGR